MRDVPRELEEDEVVELRRPIEPPRNDGWGADAVPLDDERLHADSGAASDSPPGSNEGVDFVTEPQSGGNRGARGEDGWGVPSHEPQLSDVHRDALRDYTGVGHLEMNTVLREGTVEQIEDLATRSAALSEALERMPAHEGTVLRGSNTNLDETILARYEPGERIVENQYVSSTLDPEVEFPGNVIWIIDSKQGRDVQGESSVPGEREVLFDRFSEFEVLAKDYDDRLGRWVIYMEEM